ncbi:MAG: hypothetical protein HRU76_06620 [Phycisphaeraceae bacterium]|nr:MAG: hypothetical protein HRU76_06620 [Phycisphaeraceae bacterium]
MPRWMWFNHVPEGIDLSPDQVARVKRLVRDMGPGRKRYSNMSRRMVVRLVPGMLAITGLFLWWMLWFVGSIPPGGTAAALLVAGILGYNLLLWVVIAWSINRAVAPLVWRALNRIGIRVCEGCGYILQNLPEATPRCPECGEGWEPPPGPDAPLTMQSP